MTQCGGSNGDPKLGRINVACQFDKGHGGKCSWAFADSEIILAVARMQGAQEARRIGWHREILSEHEKQSFYLMHPGDLTDYTFVFEKSVMKTVLERIVISSCCIGGIVVTKGPFDHVFFGAESIPLVRFSKNEFDPFESILIQLRNDNAIKVPRPTVNLIVQQLFV